MVFKIVWLNLELYKNGPEWTVLSYTDTYMVNWFSTKAITCEISLYNEWCIN